MNATLKDIAEKSDVSIYSVMRVLNGKNKGQRKDAKLRAERIWRIARELNYKPNDAARALVTKRTGNLGFILAREVDGGIKNQYYGSILNGVERVCRKYGYGLHFGIGSLLDIKDFIYPKAVAGRNVDALFLAGACITQEVAAEFEKTNIPCMCFSRSDINLGNMIRVHRSSTALRGVFEECYRAGHRRVGVIEWQNQGSQARQKELSDWVKEHEMQYISIPLESYKLDDMIDKVIENYLDMPKDERPTVLVSFANSCMKLINELGLRGITCPEDISIVSYGSDNYNEHFRPKLTALDFDSELFGEKAAEILIEHLQNNKSLDEIKVLDISPNIKIIKGESLKVLKQGPQSDRDLCDGNHRIP